MAGKSPTDRAAELVAGTRLGDVAVRKRLAEGGLAAVEASHDPMIELARLVDPTARKLRRCVEQNVQESLQQAYGRLARARFALEGTSVYPDATFTLRLAFGVVAATRTPAERFRRGRPSATPSAAPTSTAAASPSPCRRLGSRTKAGST